MPFLLGRWCFFLAQAHKVWVVGRLIIHSRVRSFFQNLDLVDKLGVEDVIVSSTVSHARLAALEVPR